jgi:hypothetical protein
MDLINAPENPQRLRKILLLLSHGSLESTYDIVDFIHLDPHRSSLPPKSQKKYLDTAAQFPNFNMKDITFFDGFAHFFLVELSTFWGNAFINVAKDSTTAQTPTQQIKHPLLSGYTQCHVLHYMSQTLQTLQHCFVPIRSHSVEHNLTHQPIRQQRFRRSFSTSRAKFNVRCRTSR